MCTFALVCVRGCVCRQREREGCIWMTAKLNARADEATGSQWERWGQDIAGSGREMLALSPALTHGQTVSGGVCNWLSFNMSLDEESVVLEERKGGDVGRLFPWWDTDWVLARVLRFPDVHTEKWGNTKLQKRNWPHLESWDAKLRELEGWRGSRRCT